jgi:hypothetical protein
VYTMLDDFSGWLRSKYKNHEHHEVELVPAD